MIERTQYAPKPMSAGTRANSSHGVPAIEPTMIAATIAMSQSVEVLRIRDRTSRPTGMCTTDSGSVTGCLVAGDEPGDPRG